VTRSHAALLGLRSCPLAAALPALCLALTACGAREEAAASSVSEAAVTLGPEDLATVKVDTVRSGPPIVGVLKARNQATMRAEVGGAVAALDAEQGDRVEEGQLLARIADTTASEQLSAARSTLRSARHGLETAQLDYARTERVAAAGGLAARDLERAKVTLEAAKAQAADAQARLAAAEQHIARTEVRAPFAGIVAERAVSLGDVVQSGAALFAIIDPSTLRLEATLPAADLSQVRVGYPVDFSVSGYPRQTFSGVGDAIGPSVDPNTGPVRLTVSVENLKGRLLAGLFGQGRVASETRRALTAPLAAIDTSTDPPTVVRLRDQHAERVAVQTGLRDDLTGVVELRSGVAPGDTLVLEGARASLRDGVPVRVSAP
jgi:membrane fusion protein, multidrug efflux system